MAERPPLVVVQGPGVVVQDVPSTDLLKVNKVAITPTGGVAIQLYNPSGGTISKGRIVEPSSTTNEAFQICPTSSNFAIGVVYEDIPATSYGWIVVSGIAEVYLDNAGGTLRDYVVLVSTANAGQGTAQATVPSTTDHWREVGHTVGTSGAPGLVKCVLHFN